MTIDEIAATVMTGDALSRELDEDAVGLWKVAWHLRRLLPPISDAHLQEIVEGVLRGLLRTAVAVGDVDAQGSFHKWCDQGVEELMTSWRQLGHDPNIGDIAWLYRER